MIQKIIEKWRIEEILHFTTNRGITGILATGALKARSQLAKEQYLEYIYQYNCSNRSRDQDWWGYANLSITFVNRQLFDISSGKWHANEDAWWCVLSFSTDICSHEGVYFTTTNNMYSSVSRQKGAEGLDALFAPQILQWPGKIISRLSTLTDNRPTCEQAEVLYPNEVSLKYLNRIYVANNTDAAKLDSIKSIFQDWRHIPCEVRNELF